MGTSINEIPLKKIQQKENSRQNYNEDDLSQLMASMKNHGLLQPIGVRRIKGGGYECVFGNRRLIAAQKLGWKSIQAIPVDKAKDDDMIISNITENIHREQVPLPQLGRAFEKLRRMGLKDSEIASRMSIPLTRVRMALESFQRMPAKVRNKIVVGVAGQKIKKGKIPARTAFKALDIVDKFDLKGDERDALFDYAAEDGVSGDHIRVIGGLMAAGITLPEAIERADTTRVISIMVPMDSAVIDALEAKYKRKIGDILFTALCSHPEFKIHSGFRSDRVILRKKAVAEE